jgi:hypothetical protein
MRPLSATEAISPAIEHSKALLRPFSLGLWLKLGSVAVFAEMGGQFIAPPIGNFPHHASQTPRIGVLAGGITPLIVGVLVAVAMVGLLIGFGLLYLGSRLQLVLIDLVATRTTVVGDAWYRTAPRTWRWIGVKVACFLIVFAVIATLAVVPIISLIHSLPADNAPPGAGLFGSIALLLVVIFFMVFVLLLATWILRDFMLPSILFEDASLPDSLARAASLIRNEPGPVLFYFFIKFVVAMAAAILAELCLGLVAVLAAIPTAIAAAILWYALHNSSSFGLVWMYAGFALLAVVFLAVVFAAILSIGGATLIFMQACALYFIGGRIPQVGNLLETPPFLPPTLAPPVSPA